MAYVARICRACGDHRRVSPSRELCPECAAVFRRQVAQGVRTWPALEAAGLCRKLPRIDRRNGRTIAPKIEVEKQAKTESKGEDMATVGDCRIHGLTIREAFAAAALVGLLASEGAVCVPGDEAAKLAVEHADKLLRELNRTAKGGE